MGGKAEAASCRMGAEAWWLPEELLICEEGQKMFVWKVNHQMRTGPQQGPEGPDPKPPPRLPQSSPQADGAQPGSSSSSSEAGGGSSSLTGDGGCVVGRVGPQVLGGVCGWLRHTLGAAAVTHAGSQRQRNTFLSPPPPSQSSTLSRSNGTNLSSISIRFMLWRCMMAKKMATRNMTTQHTLTLM